MIELLAKLWIKDHKNIGKPKVRQAYGMLCGGLGIALNFLLFAGKFLAGAISGSIAITADAFNNLSDAGASVVTLAGFRLESNRIGNFVAKTFDLMNEANRDCSRAQQALFAANVSYKIKPGLYSRIASALHVG